MTLSRRFATGAALLASGVAAANFGIAAWRYRTEYLRRRLFWGSHEDMGDPQRFPSRAIPAAAVPFRFVPDPGGLARVRQAFAEAGPRHGAGAEPLEGFLARTQSTSLLVLQHDRLACEFYANGAARDTALTSMSMSKSVLGLLVAAAVGQGAIPGLDTPAAQLLPDIAGLQASGVTLRHLMHMAAGLEFENAWPLHRLSLPWLFDGGKVAYFTPDIPRYIATARPGRPPGSHFRYDDRSAQLVGLILQRSLGASVSASLARLIWDPVGAEYNASWNLDHADGFEKMESGLNAAALDWLKLGRLVLRDGDWAGARPVLPASLVRTITGPQDEQPGFTAGSPSFNDGSFLYYGLLWWGFGGPGGVPECFAGGLFGQTLYVARRHGAVLLRTGLAEGGVPSWPALLRDMAAALPQA